MAQNEIDTFCVNVIDGDTLEVRWRKRRRKVRLLGVDTPETHNHGKRHRQAKRYHLDEKLLYRIGQEATRISLQYMVNQRVMLHFPDRIGQTDDYGRLLCYVQLPNGMDMGAELLARGLAFPRNDYHPKRSYYFDLLKEAKKSKRGFFNAGK